MRLLRKDAFLQISIGSGAVQLQQLKIFRLSDPLRRKISYDDLSFFQFFLIHLVRTGMKKFKFRRNRLEKFFMLFSQRHYSQYMFHLFVAPCLFLSIILP